MGTTSGTSTGTINETQRIWTVGTNIPILNNLTAEGLAFASTIKSCDTFQKMKIESDDMINLYE